MGNSLESSSVSKKLRLLGEVEVRGGGSLAPGYSL